MSTAEERVIELTKEISLLNQVSFCPHSVMLEGVYTDELSAFRAKKSWIETMEHSFLLDCGHDFEITLSGDIQAAEFKVACAFTTACGRYAFWRLTNNQAPEAQYQIETAHIPNAESLYARILSAPDLGKKKHTAIFELDESFQSVGTPRPGVVSWLRAILKGD